MAKEIRRDFGKFISCLDKNTGEEYTDWRKQYYGLNGVIVLGESERKHPGWFFLFLPECRLAYSALVQHLRRYI